MRRFRTFSKALSHLGLKDMLVLAIVQRQNRNVRTNHLLEGEGVPSASHKFLQKLGWSRMVMMASITRSLLDTVLVAKWTLMSLVTEGCKKNGIYRHEDVMMRMMDVNPSIEIYNIHRP